MKKGPLSESHSINIVSEEETSKSGKDVVRRQLDNFDEIRIVHCYADRQPGERPKPLRFVARELKSGILLDYSSADLCRNGPPYASGPKTLIVCYDAPLLLGCLLTLGWPLPTQVLDLHAEYRCQTSGLLKPGDYSLTDALNHLQANGEELLGNPLKALERLLGILLPTIDLNYALLRGRYTAAVAWMESVGVPIDVGTLARLRGGWEGSQDSLIEELDRDFGVYHGRKFNPRRWRAWVNHHHIPWPRTAPGKLDVRLDIFKEMADYFPQIRPMKELRVSLAMMKPDTLPVGRDGRNRCSLRPFAAKTGRNAPSSTQFVFNLATWARGLVKPTEGHALAYVDYEQQEFGIAAALSGDRRMQEAYRSGDPYLAFAQQAGAVPANATKQTHRDERERFKHCALGVQYGMGAGGLGIRLGVSLVEAKAILGLHKETYPTYWAWSEGEEKKGFANNRLQSRLGWMLNVGPESNPRSIRNFPLQANGAEMLRLACISLTEGKIRVCAPVHDAILIESPMEDIEEAVSRCQSAMAKASTVVLKGFPLRTDPKVIKWPDRYMDERGREAWDKLTRLIGE